MKNASLALLFLALTACSGGGATSANDAQAHLAADPRAAAIQATLSVPDKTPMATYMINGQTCHSGRYDGAPGNNPLTYRGMPGVHVRADAPRRDLTGIENCWTVSWDPSTGIRQGSAYGYWDVPIGRFIVDKVGDDQPAALGTHMTPYRAHFQATPLGKALIKAGLVRRPEDILDGQAFLHKDADGKLVAQ